MTTTVTATAEPDATPPRVRLNLTTDKTSLTVYRVAQDGSRTPVRTYDGGPLPLAGTTAVLYDPEAFFGLPYTYTTDDAATTASASVTLAVSQPWLVHPGVPTRSVPVTLMSMSERQAAASQSVRYPLGRRFPIVANDGQRKADAYTLTVETDGATDLASLQALLDDLSPLLLNVPADPTWVDLSSEYIAVGDLKRANPGGFVQLPNRFWSFDCSVVGRPSGGSQAFNTYGLSKSLYATYGDRHTAHATYGAAFNT